MPRHSSVATVAVLATALGWALIVVGCTMVAAWLGIVVAGIGLVAFGALLDEPKRKKRGPS